MHFEEDASDYVGKGLSGGRLIIYPPTTPRFVPVWDTAGDHRRGQSLIVWAIREDRDAAREIDRYLMGRTMLP